MLVMSRNEEQAIVVNSNIKIVVTKIRGKKVWLGVEAPKEIPVFREELLKQENKDGRILDRDVTTN